MVKKFEKAIPKNVKADNAFAEVGVVKPLSDVEYQKVIEIYKKTIDFSKTVKFDEKTEIVWGKIPEKLTPRLMEKDGQAITNAEGENLYSVSIITSDENYWSLSVPETEKNDFEAYQGMKIAVVGKPEEKEGTDKYAGKTLRNIKKYRGSVLLEYGKTIDDVSV